MELDSVALLPLALGAVLTTGLFAFYRGFRCLRHARIIEDTPTSNIRSAAQGYCELQGRAEMMPGHAIVSPLTGMRCAWYQYRVDRRGIGRIGLQGTPPWVNVNSGRSDGVFMLRDEGANCIVDPDGASVRTGEHDVWYGNSDQPLVGPKAGPTGILGALFHRYRYSEKRIDHGDPLYAIGQFRTLGGGQERSEVTAEVSALLRTWKRDQRALIHRFDSNRNGKIDASEWAHARAVARKHVLQETAKRAASPDINLLSDTGESGLPYLLSTLPPESLVRNMRRLAAFWLGLFLFSGAAGSWLLVTWLR